MALWRSDDQHDIHVRLQNPGGIGNELYPWTTSLKILPCFPTSGAYWPHARQTARKQAIEHLKIRPNHVAGPDDSNCYWTQSSCSSGDAAGAGS